MMGNETVSEIRAELRKAYGMSDDELREWFDQRIRDSKVESKAPTAIETLELLRDALLRREKIANAKRKSSRTIHGSKR